jgi:hypothetical protein
MAKEQLTIPLVGGIDLKTDPKVLPPDRLTTLQNASFNRHKALIKRSGYTELNTELLDGTGYMTGSTGLHRLGDQLLNSDTTHLNAYLPSLGKWTRVGRLPAVYTSNSEVSSTGAFQRNPVSLEIDSLVWFAWEQDGYVTVSIIDKNAGQNIVSDQRVAAGQRPLLVEFNGNVILMLVSGTTISIIILNLAKVRNQNFSPSATISGLSSDMTYDTLSLGNYLYVLYSTDSGTTGTLRQFDTSFHSTDVVLNEGMSRAGTLCSYDSDNVLCLLIDDVSRCHGAVLDESLEEIVALTELELNVAEGEAADPRPPGEPFHWFRGDHPLDSAGTLYSTWSDVVSTATMGNADSARLYSVSSSLGLASLASSLTHPSYLSSSLTGSAYSFMNDGNGWTIGMSFKTPPSLVAANHMLSTMGTGLSLGNIIKLASSRIQFTSKGTSTGSTIDVTQLQSTPLLQASTWYSAVFRQSAAHGSELWVNGTLNATSGGLATAPSIYGPAHTLELGRVSSGYTVEMFSGSWGEVVLYDTRLGSGAFERLVDHMERYRTGQEKQSFVSRIGANSEQQGQASVFTEADGIVYRSPLSFDRSEVEFSSSLISTSTSTGAVTASCNISGYSDLFLFVYTADEFLNSPHEVKLISGSTHTVLVAELDDRSAVSQYERWSAYHVSGLTGNTVSVVRDVWMNAGTQSDAVRIYAINARNIDSDHVQFGPITYNDSGIRTLITQSYDEDPSAIGFALASYSFDTDFINANSGSFNVTDLLSGSSANASTRIIGAYATGSVVNIGATYPNFAGVTGFVPFVVRGLLTASLGSGSSIANDASLTSKPFVFNGEECVAVVTSGSLDSSQYIVSAAGSMIARHNQTTAGARTSGSLPTPVVTEDGTATLPSERFELFETDDQIDSLQRGTTSIVESGMFVGDHTSVKFHDVLHFPGAIMRSYDGASICETSFLARPQVNGIRVLNSGEQGISGNVEEGAYLYAFLYQWKDKLGQVNYSQPSRLEVLQVANDNSAVVFDISPLVMTEKLDVRIIGYRSSKRTSSSLDIPLYRFTDVEGYENDPDASSIVIVDETADIENEDNWYMYTFDEIENAAPPPCIHLAAYNNRLWTLSTDQPNTVHYSKTSVEGRPVAFSDGFSINVQDDDDQVITAMGATDDKLYVFKPTKTFKIQGQGPQNNGEGQNDLRDAQLVTSDVGCTVPKSIELLPQGLIFKSAKGIYLIDRGEQVVPVGKQVEAYNDLEITRAIVVPNKDQVRFLTTEDTCLIYDYSIGQWCTWTNHASAGSIIVNDVLYFSREDGQVLFESEDRFKDVDRFYKLKMETGWIRPANINGYQRMHKVMILGDYKGQHRLRIKVAFNDNPLYTKERVFDTADILQPVEWELGEALDFSTEFSQYQFAVNVGKRCNSMRISIEDEQEDNYNEGYTINAITLEYERFSGVNRLPGKKRGST